MVHVPLQLIARHEIVLIACSVTALYCVVLESVSPETAVVTHERPE